MYHVIRITASCLSYEYHTHYLEIQIYFTLYKPMSTTEGTTTEKSCCKFEGFKVPYILTWKNPYETGVLLAKILVIFAIGIKMTPRCFFKLFFYSIGSLSALEAISKAVTGTGIVSSMQPSRFLFLSDYMVDDFASHLSCVFRRLTVGFMHLIDARNPCQGIRLSAAAFVIYILLGVFSVRNLIFTIIISAFSLPPLYIANKEIIDQGINQTIAQAHELTRSISTKVHEKAGKQIDCVKNLVGPILGPRGGFPGHANVSPIGEVPTAAAKPTEHTSTKTPTTEELKDLTKDYDSVPTLVGNVSLNKEKSTDVTAEDLKELTNKYDSVPTLSGNVPIDHTKLNATIDAGAAEAEAAKAASSSN